MSARAGAKLAVFLRGEPLGAIERRGPSRYRFTYSEQAFAAPNAEGDVPLSASLPLRQKGFTPSQSAPFFEGLLPEGSVRKAMARKFGLSEDDGFGLLRELGVDCAGAVVVLPEGEEPAASGDEGVRLLSPDELETLVDELPRRPLGVSDKPDGLRLSLGGVQDKLVLTRTHSGQYGQPTGGAPSTCLLKPDYGHYEDLAANEAFCMKVASAMGLEVADTEIVRIGSTPCLYVERFDRAAVGDGRIVRIHQEDMCQALGILPAARYEANGGPSVAAVVGLLRDLRTPRAAADINAFVKAVLVNFLLGNSDAHGKNFALLYDPATGTRLAPLYDIVSTSIYPELTDRMAMAVGGVDEPESVDLAAWERLASDSGFGGQLPGFIRRWSADVLRCVEEVRLEAEAEGWHLPAIDKIIELCRVRAGRVAAVR
ncbi:MAG TPA: type II toxin-antitoxin system HipA family toxin [Solirubrobacterales bacterium]|jgi:serine/threonine-protein kinase HipA|nr:type II toxin-antitoxin system HipA family toxin [Solirubrobacterales bacterium]